MDQHSVCWDQAETSAAKALAVLEYIGLSGGCALSDLACNSKLPKSTLLRLIGTLVEAGFVKRTGPGRYRTTPKAWRVGCSAVDYEHVSDAVMPVLHQLVAATSETVHYAVYEDGYAVYVEKVDGLHPIRAYSSVGGRSPAYASATGKALLAWQTRDEIARVAATTMQLTPATHVGLVALEREMAHVRSLGHAINRGEWREGVWGIGAPVFGRSGEVVAAVGISGPKDRIAANLDGFTAAVRDAHRELSAQHGSFEKTA